MAFLKAPFVLAVHENRSVRNLLQAILKHAGYGVVAVASEKEASRLLRHGHPGIRLLIVDQGGSPPPAGAASPLSREGMKVLYLTSFRSLPERVADALRHPESGFLAKPFSPRALLNLVEALIGRPEEARGEPAAETEWAPRGSVSAA